MATAKKRSTKTKSKSASRKAPAQRRQSKASGGVEAELLRVTNAGPQSAKEDRQDFLKRIGAAVNALADNDFNDLSEEARGWFERAGAATQKKQALPEFREQVSQPSKTTEETEMATTRSKTSKSKKAPAKAKRGGNGRLPADTVFTVAPDYPIREGKNTGYMIEAARELKRFNRDQLVEKTKRKLTEERARRYISWFIGHEVFLPT